ncbi:MAG: Hint domain-containing protein [Pseudomonadota bacterium]
MTLISPIPAPLGVPILRDHSLRHALPAGSRVLTARGEALVETLVQGDRVISRDHGMVRIRDVVRGEAPRGAAMVLFPAGSLGRGRPERDVLLPLDQPLVLRDWRARALFSAKEARVAALRLVDKAVIRRVSSPGLATFAIVLDRPSALYVDGLELVSGAMDALPD